MILSASKRDIVEGLRQELLSMQGLRVPGHQQRPGLDLGPLNDAFPNHTFPVAAVHELISYSREDAAATSGFLAGMLGHLQSKNGFCVWISTQRTVFPPALKAFGVAPDRVIFLDITKEKDVLWAMEESLKCAALSAVVCELQEINLTESRRLQIAVEKSRVTGFLHRYAPRKVENIACVSRWQIRAIPSELEAGMPGMGLPRWQVELVKIRNGQPTAWEIAWSNGQFQLASKNRPQSQPDHNLKTG